MNEHRTVFSILSDVLSRDAKLTPCSLADQLIRGAFDPEVSDPDLVNVLIRCENILNDKFSPELRDAAMTVLWLDTTLPMVINAVATWVEREFESASKVAS